jgi:hypothetical protein
MVADLEFTGSIPELYDRYLVPLIFEGSVQPAIAGDSDGGDGTGGGGGKQGP